MFHWRNAIFLLPPLLILLLLRNLDFMMLEVALLGVLLLGGWLARRVWTGRIRAPRWTRNPIAACAIPAIASAALRLALVPWIPIPHPLGPDEFSHVFLAKTLLLGRLANPPHPLWQHFETIHIIPQPTFSSMYMAGQACFLAAGKLLVGNFFGGVLLETALFCAALVWFLRAYVPPGWAFYGGMIAAVRFGAASYWNDSFWGGSAAALGGAMALGAYPRLVRSWKPIPALMFAAGLLLLANTRPYEGAALALILVGALGWQAVRSWKRISGRRLAWSLAASGIVAGLGGWAMTRHFQAVTGDPLMLPYQVNQRTYGWPGTVPWFHARPIEYRHRALGIYHEWESGEHEFLTEPTRIPQGLLIKYSFLWRFYFGVMLSATLLFTPAILRRRRERLVWIAAAAVGLLVLTEQSGYPHYLAPVAPAVLLFAVEGLRRLEHWRPRAAPLGPVMVWGAIPAMLVVIGVRAATLRPSEQRNFGSWCCMDARIWDREPLERKLNEMPGEQLVLVRDELATWESFDWVYNEPDIDRAKIVWARDMGPEKNRELLEYFARRRVWRVRIEKHGATLEAGAEPGAGGGDVAERSQIVTGPGALTARK